MFATDSAASHRDLDTQFGETSNAIYGWCFSDLETARTFVGQFGRAFYKTSGI
jgi:hypothetical protein